MIPITLEISNFLSYRDTAVLDFRGLHLACISGPNGAGKSSILDAMTWALFGQSRSKSDDDLVNRIAARSDDWAEVRFTFRIEEAVYRITRRRRATKSTVLELQLATDFDEGGNPTGWKALTESRIRETQSAIESILRMNFDSFINASFFLQGKADEFTTKTPARRKEILAELLGINVWDSYKEKVTVQRKAQEDQIRFQEARIVEIKQELDEEPERAARVEQLAEQNARIQEQLAAKESVQQNLRKLEAAVQQQKQQLEALYSNRQRAQQQLDSLLQARQQRETELARFQTLLDSAETIKANFIQWSEHNEAVKKWQFKANAHNALGRQMEPHRLTIAREKTRLEQQLAQLEQQREGAEQAAAERKNIEEKVVSLREELTAFDGQIGRFDTQLTALQRAKEALQAQRGERDLWQKEANALHQEAERIAQLAAAQTQLAAQRDEAQNAAEQLAAQLAELQTQARESVSLEAELVAIEGEMPHLQREMNALKAKLDQLEATTAAACPLCGQPLSDEHRKQAIAEMQANGKEMGDRYRGHQKRIVAINNQLGELKSAVSQQSKLERQQTLQQAALAQAAAKLGEGERAIAAWQMNGRVRLNELEQKLAERAAIDALEQEVAQLQAAVAEKSGLDQKRQRALQSIAQSEARLQSLQETVERWENTGRQAHKTTRSVLDDESYAAEAQSALAALEKEAEAVQYDAFAHHEAAEALAKLADAPEKHQALQKAEINRDSLRGSIASLDGQINAQEESVAEYASQVKQQEASLSTLAESSAGLDAIEKEVNRLRDESIQKSQELGAARQSLDVLVQQRKRLDALQGEKKALSERLQKLKLLEEACGRNGVQALLIEAAKPDIELRANELLERLTGGNMRVAFEMQREAKSKKSAKIETFDIRIIDGVGERPYENYSGGEQFRVNFAIRLALSQILARRAGAKLQTLVIDEGFGSQDPNGRQRLVEAINTIQGDFERILVITHIEALREAFPSQIVVEKGVDGSQIVVN